MRDAADTLLSAVGEERIAGLQQAILGVEGAAALIPEGRLRRMVGLTLEAEGCQAPVGDLYTIKSDRGSIDAEVVGFSDDRLFLMPTGRVQGLTGNLRVKPARKTSQVGVGDGLLGRVVDGSGKPLDSFESYQPDTSEPLHGQPIKYGTSRKRIQWVYAQIAIKQGGSHANIAVAVIRPVMPGK